MENAISLVAARRRANRRQNTAKWLRFGKNERNWL
jgi:hypothetical protein